MDYNEFMFSFLNREKSMFSSDLETNSIKLTENIRGKNILIIGGAGTIGSSFLKAALKFEPKKVVIVDINENGLTELVRDLRSTINQFVPQEFFTYPLSFDNPAFFKLFKSHGPFDIVANFAAHKHVRSEKDIFSIEALLENNIIKAKGLLDLLVDYPPSHFFCVSTDKAANPVNIMGASKKLMEELILTYSSYFKITTARFANVAFSNGSLLEGFIKRIEKHQPLACPSDVKRFFVTPQESGEICLMACVLGKNSEVFFPKLDMVNDLVNFAEIYTPLLKKFGFEPLIVDSEEMAKEMVSEIEKGKYPVFLFKSNTSGEKLFEEFYTEEEVVELNKFNSLGFISKKATYSKDEMDKILDELKEAFSFDKTSKCDIVNLLKKYITNFYHIETGFGLDSKM
jgi:FlaA1/EpsC-like NDP-sugar epimerase